MLTHADCIHFLDHHQANVLRILRQALDEAGITDPKTQLDAVAYTKGPGELSLLPNHRGFVVCRVCTTFLVQCSSGVCTTRLFKQRS